jgi:Organic Anion Transporter Polypeptide (OATP) family
VFGVVGLIFASSHAYYNGTITTMEKRFKISSKQMGFIATGNDITSFILSSFIAYYGGRGDCFMPHSATDNVQLDLFKATDRDGWRSALSQS